MPDKFETAFKVTAWFETGDQPFTQASGNFDKQGLSWGPRQTCIGQGSLQPLLRRMIKEEGISVQQCLNDSLQLSLQKMLDLPSTEEQLSFCVTKMNDSNNRLLPEWNMAFMKLGSIKEIQQIFMDEATASVPAVDGLAKYISGGESPTMREWVWAFDVVTQNGGLATWFRAILAVIKPMLAPFKKDDRDWLRTVSWLRAAQSYVRGNRPFAIDVLSRKLLIVEGHGKFRGGYVDLDQKFGVSDNGAD